MAPTLGTDVSSLPPEGAVSAWGGPAPKPAPTLGTDVSSLPPEGAVSAWGGPAPKPLVLTLGTDMSSLLGERGMSKLKWRCRRGLLENDLLIEKFFARHEATLSVRQAKGLNDLMDLADNDLLDLLLKRKEPGQLSDANAKASASTLEALEVLDLLRPQAVGPVTPPPDTRERPDHEVS